MARKTRSGTRQQARQDEPTQAARDAAQKIWLAGLGAFERAREEGPRMFESLVEQGRNMGARAVGAADEALKGLRQADFAGGRWERLEQAVEETVARSLHRLGVTTSREVEALAREVRDLNEKMRELVSQPAAPAAKRKAPASRKGAARKAGARKAATGRKAAARKSKSRSAP